MNKIHLETELKQIYYFQQDKNGNRVNQYQRIV